MNTRPRFLALCAALLLPVVALAQVTGTFSGTTTVQPNGQIVPTLTWSTTPEAASCTASGAWSGTKAASGTETLPAITPPKAYTLTCLTAANTQAVLTWTPPTQNTDNTPLTNLSGFRVLYGPAANSLTQSVEVNNPAATGRTISNLSPGTWFFAVRAKTSQGAESANSNVASKTTTAGFEWTQTFGITSPNSPTALSVE